MNIHLQPAVFHSTYKQNSYVNTIPSIEGFDADNVTEQAYTSISNDIKNNTDYLKCTKDNNERCNQLDKDVKEHDKSKNVTKDKKNKAYIDFQTCKASAESCNILYNDMTRKTNEFHDIYKKINTLDSKINTCIIDKSVCDRLKLEITKLQTVIHGYEKDLQLLKEQANQNKC